MVNCSLTSTLVLSAVKTMSILATTELVLEVELEDGKLVSLELEDDVRDVSLLLVDALLLDGVWPKSQPARVPTNAKLSNTVLIDFFILRFLSSTVKRLLVCA